MESDKQKLASENLKNLVEAYGIKGGEILLLRQVFEAVESFLHGPAWRATDIDLVSSYLADNFDFPRITDELDGIVKNYGRQLMYEGMEEGTDSMKKSG